MQYIADGQLHKILGAVGEQMAAARAHARIVVIGGSALVATGFTSRATRDVDVVALVRDGNLVTAEPLPAELRTAAELVARDFDLADDWLNAGPTSLMEIGGGLPARLLDRAVTRTYGPAFTVDFAGRVDLIGFKVYACASRRAPRDRSDLGDLSPTPDELAAAARWVRTLDAPGPLDDELRTLLGEFGVVDVGRDA